MRPPDPSPPGEAGARLLRLLSATAADPALGELTLAEWRALAELAQRKLVAGVVRGALSSADSVPDEIQELFQPAATADAARRLLVERELEELGRCLAGAGLEALVLKGAALTGYYPSGVGRVMQDVDLLARPEDFAACVTALGELGYTLEAPPSYHATLHAEGRLPLELHRELQPPGFPVVLPTAAMWRGSECSRPGLCAPTPEALALHLAAHTLRDQFQGDVRPLADLAALAATSGALDVDYLVETARRHDLDAALAVLLVLVHEHVQPLSGDWLTLSGRWGRPSEGTLEALRLEMLEELPTSAPPGRLYLWLRNSWLGRRARAEAHQSWAAELGVTRRPAGPGFLAWATGLRRRLRGR